MNTASRFSVTTLFLVTAALIGLAAPAASAQQLFGDFVGINIHQGVIHQAGRQNTAPTLYDPVQNLVRDYHGMAWDVSAPGTLTSFPWDLWHMINWDTEYGNWVATGTKVNACVTVEQFPDEAEWGADPYAAAYQYGVAFATAFGPTVGSGMVNSVQIGNEPGDMSDSLYIEVFEGMAAGIRSVDPAMIIVTCNVQNAPSGNYHKDINLFGGITSLIDAYATHSYPFLHHWPTYEKSYPEDTGMTYLTTVQQMHAWVQTFDPTAQSWITEFGYDASSKSQPGDFMDVTDTQQAQWLMRSYFAWLDIGLDRAYMYWFNDSDSYSLHACSGLTRNWSPKPSYYAQSHMLATLEDYYFTGAVTKSAGNLYVFGFMNKNDTTDLIWVLWSPTGNGRQATVTLDDLPGTPLSAERMPLNSGGAPSVGFTVLDIDSIEIQVTESPTYLRIQGSSSGNLPPVVDAGPNQIVSTNTVQLVGTAIDDGNPDPPGALILNWSKISGPGTVEFTSTNTEATTATLSDPGVYVLRFGAYDGGVIVTDDVIVTYEALPQLAFTRTDLGAGLYGWTFRIVNGDELLLSYAATMSFYVDGGTTLVNPMFGTPPNHVNDEPTAIYAAGYGFDDERDTYSLSPFIDDYGIPGISELFGTEFTGYRQDTDYWEMSVGTGAGSQYGNNTPVAYVVADGNVHWIGTIARNNQLYSDSGVTDLPEGLLGDFSGDGVVDTGDYTIWADSFGDLASESFAPGSYLEPDHIITTADYTVWADHFGDSNNMVLNVMAPSMPEPVLVTGGAAEGDYNGDGVVNLADYTVWADSYAGSPVSAVLNVSAAEAPAVSEEEDDEPEEALTPAARRRAIVRARRDAIRQARKARLEARRQIRMERLN